MKTIWILAGLLVGVGPVALAQAQTVRLTLDDAIALARRQNPAYRRAVNSRNASGASVRAGWGGLLPTLTGSISTSATHSTRSAGEGDFGQVVEQPSVSFTTSGSSQGLSANLTVFDGLQNVNNLRAAKADARVAHSEVNVQETSLVASVSTAFYEALRRQRLISVEERLLKTARDQLEVTERFLAVARTDQIDILGARVDVARAEQSLALASANSQRAELDLLTAMGVEDGAPITLSGEPPAVFNPAQLDPDALVQRAFRINPLVSQLDAQVAAAQHRSAAAKGAWLPSITASGSFNRNVNNNQFQGFFDLNPSDNRTFGFSISASIPLFDGFQRARQVATANETARNAAETRRERRLAIEREVRAAFIDLANRYRSLAIARQSAVLANERLELSRQQYQLGALDFYQLQVVVQQNAQEQRSLVNAEFDYARALVELERAVGEPLRP